MVHKTEQLKSVIEALQELNSDNAVPKNIKLKLSEIISLLSNGENDISIKINKSLNILDEISDDNNIQPYSRTQVWNIVSMMEALQN